MTINTNAATANSSGQVSAVIQPPFPVQAADDLNLESYFARNTVADPSWRVMLGKWWNTNGTAADFFLFEVGGNHRHEVVIAHQFADLFSGGVAFRFGLIRCRPQFGADHRLPAVEERLLDTDDRRGVRRAPRAASW